MAIPFKSPISFGNTVLKENNSDEFEISAAAGTTLMLGPHTATMETDGNKIALIPSGINITNNGKNILQHNSGQNLFGYPTVRAVLQGYPFYIAGDSVSEDVLASDENGITLSNNVKNTNIKGSNIVIDGSKLTVPTNTRLKSIAEDRVFTLQGLACIGDINNAIINKKHFSHVWELNQDIIFVTPGNSGTTQLMYQDNDTIIYTFEEDVNAILGIRSGVSGTTETLTLIKIKNDSFVFENKNINLTRQIVWKNTNNSNFTYISNYNLL